LKKILVIIIVLLVSGLIYILVQTDKEEEKTWTSENSLSQVHSPELKDGNDLSSLILAIENSLIYLNKKEEHKTINFGKDKYSIKQIKDSLEDFKKKLEAFGFSEKFFNYIKENYTFYNSNAEKVLFTGYYEAGLSGSYKQSDIYKYPIYKKPENLVRIDLKDFTFFKDKKELHKVLKGRLTKANKIIPFYSRDEIDYKKVLDDKKLEILWVDDQIDLFFLQIQGSGIVQMDDGSSVRVNYSENNGHPYRAIGRYLVDNNYMELKDVSMQSIRKFLKDNPEKTQEIFNYNPSYVFFREVKEGPIGSIGVPLTPYRSIATDKNIFPRGALCFIKTKIPVFNEKDELIEWKEFISFVLNQDTGGAIRSPGRVDIFTGFGKESELKAGYMKEYGQLLFLMKNNRI